MSVNNSNVEITIVQQLKITEDEAKVFLILVRKGRMEPTEIAKVLAWENWVRAKLAADSLVEKGMVIQISSSEFESLHPRFAITNRYRRRCEAEGIPFKKNVLIDNIGVLLEKPYEDARTK